MGHVESILPKGSFRDAESRPTKRWSYPRLREFPNEVFRGGTVPVILCDVTQAYHAASGGIKTYLEAKREFLRRFTNHTHVLIRPGAEDCVDVDDRLCDVKVRGFEVPGASGYRLIVAMNHINARLMEFRPDVVELATAYLLPGVWKTARSMGSTLSAFYHTDFPSAYVEPFARRLFGTAIARRLFNLAELYLRHTHKRFDVNFVASQLFQQQLKTRGVPRLVLLPLGVDTRLFHPQRRDSELRRSLGASASDSVFIYAGRLDQEKCVETLLDAFQKIEKRYATKLWLVGDGPDRTVIERRVAGSSTIRLLPYETDRKRLATLLASADAYASAAPFETFGLSVVEAQASGKPVVGVRAGAMVDRVSANNGRLVPRGDVEALANAMGEMCSPIAKVLGSAGRKMVEEELSWDSTIEQQVCLYERLAHSNDGVVDHE